jgi:hypothetical protein
MLVRVSASCKVRGVIVNLSGLSITTTTQPSVFKGVMDEKNVISLGDK